MKFPWVTDHVKSKANKEMKKCHFVQEKREKEKLLYDCIV